MAEGSPERGFGADVSVVAAGDALGDHRLAGGDVADSGWSGVQAHEVIQALSWLTATAIPRAA
ncbi:hypothetical protein SAMN05421810_1183 [Amycolatopsis arida]|uniref:Uncharacterized protein n=1 Tax=Amycolatopsis arida TaxID=587909 RepID=A0A1I6B0B9_9PSEU|nr:hypothetical protein [Amycolatopsis arida]TDX83593.1 hypothetical protein CLV69_11927 [Amycolatopsis arida]SFQ74408.1 hypothetical protein SAMN05421810_1183 [Amycolatopsis arida]